MQEMTSEERRAFLLHGTRTAKLATVNPDGSPHVAPVWFTLDGDTLVFTTWHTTVKARNLEHNPRVAISVDDEQPPFAFVLISGLVEIHKHAPGLAGWTTRIAARYMGPEQAEAYGKRNGVEGEWLLRVTPEKIIARKNLAD